MLPSHRRCRSSVVEHSLGKGEAESSILSGSTSVMRLQTPAGIATFNRTQQANPIMTDVFLRAIVANAILVIFTSVPIVGAIVYFTRERRRRARERKFSKTRVRL